MAAYDDWRRWIARQCSKQTTTKEEDDLNTRFQFRIQNQTKKHGLLRIPPLLQFWTIKSLCLLKRTNALWSWKSVCFYFGFLIQMPCLHFIHAVFNYCVNNIKTQKILKGGWQIIHYIVWKMILVVRFFRFFFEKSWF